MSGTIRTARATSTCRPSPRQRQALRHAPHVADLLRRLGGTGHLGAPRRRVHEDVGRRAGSPGQNRSVKPVGPEPSHECCRRVHDTPERPRRALVAGRRRPHQSLARPRPRGPRDARPRPRVGRRPPSGVDHGADERARASGPLGRAPAMAVADRHPDEQRRAARARRSVATAPPLARRARAPTPRLHSPPPRPSSRRRPPHRNPQERHATPLADDGARAYLGGRRVRGRRTSGGGARRRPVAVASNRASGRRAVAAARRRAGRRARHHAASHLSRKRARHDADGVGDIRAVRADAGGCESLAARAAADRPAARARAREAPRLPDARRRAARLRPPLVQSARLDCRAAHQDRTRTGV